MGKRVKVTGSTYQTEDYSLFKRLDGNRTVKSIRVTKIKKSIEKSGYIYNPIVVNENYEVIDGQGRLEVFKMLGLPVDFVISEGAGIEECIALNASSTIWSMKDYIESFCELGYEDYILFNELLQEYPELKLNTVGTIASGIASLPTRQIKDGNLIIQKENLTSIRRDLDVAKRMVPLFARVNGTRDYYIYASVFAVRNGADIDRLAMVISKSVLNPAPTVKTALQELSDLYNKNLKNAENRIYLYETYLRNNIDKFSWYQNKWAKETTLNNSTNF